MASLVSASRFGNYFCENLRKTGRNPRRVLPGFFLAWVLFFLFWTVLEPFPGLTHNGMAVLGIVLWASVMWVSDAMPVGITGISIPTLLLVTQAIPWQGGKPPMAIIFSGFTNHVIWLCLFAFLIGAVMQLVGLDRRIALEILSRFRASSVCRVIWGMFFVNIVLGFLVPAANARAATLLPVVQGVCNLLGNTPEEREAKKAIVIQSLVYGSMICGMFIMTAHLPNMIMIGIFEKGGYTNINYLNWMLLQVPYLGMFVLTQFWLRRCFHTDGVRIAGGVESLRRACAELGPMTTPEKVLLGIFAVAGLMFVTGKGSFIVELHRWPLGVIGLLGMLLLFAPGMMPCSWKAVQEKTIWGTFLLLGGAMTMTTAMTQSGLAQWLADHIHAWVVGMNWWQTILMMMAGTHIIRLGMLSNVAAVAMLAPVVFAMAPQLGLHPVAFTMLVCDTDTFAYILPTQITAAVIAHGTDTFSSGDYARAGIVSVIIAMLYGVCIMAPWYALWGLPVWDASAPWPF
ncbi:SLC13 family permease [uncultured Desulfovibrio sp.]|uniref:SLC13 family permease n=1 Tax=uncultured Desulfovibrio sp. TaxID=167968 RepID=UPI00262A9D04|nr:SLC13 family permease [uncultured Desulfovibrio sp.]